MPFDTLSPMVTSGIRLGTPAGTTRGFDQAAFREVGGLILDVLEGLRGGTTDEAAIRQRVGALTDAFPVGKPRRD